MLLIDGVKYELWTPSDERNEFEPIVREHAQDIFGEESEYFDLKTRLESEYGKSSIPDGFVVVFGESPCWHIVEVELSKHDLHRHIVEQHSRFIMGITRAETRNRIVRAIYSEMANDNSRKQRFREAAKSDEIYPFLDEVISQPPVLTIIVEKPVKGLDEALKALSRDTISDIKVVELQTFVPEGVGSGAHAHLFAPLYNYPASACRQQGTETLGPLKHILKKNELKHRRLKISATESSLFPNVGVEFRVETDVGVFKTHVSREKPPRIRFISKWFDSHPELKIGDQLVIDVIEPMKRYRLRKA